MLLLAGREKPANDLFHVYKIVLLFFCLGKNGGKSIDMILYILYIPHKIHDKENKRGL